jgi:hypothetical protein
MTQGYVDDTDLPCTNLTARKAGTTMPDDFPEKFLARLMCNGEIQGPSRNSA